jgi:putative ABC transport system permease protein
MSKNGLFALLAALYPPHSREFTRDMVAFMVARHARAVREGRRLRFWIDLSTDTVAALVAGWVEYLSGGVGMMGMNVLARIALYESGLGFLKRRKAASAMVVVTVALALAANNVAFAVMDAFLLSSFGIPDAGRLVNVVPSREVPGLGSVPFNEAYPNYRMLEESARSFEAVAAVVQATFSWDDGQEAQALSGARTTASFVATTGAAPVLGRAFTPEEEGPSPAQVVIISHTLWRGAFSSDPDVIGRSMILDGLPHEIVGVMPAGFSRPLPSDVWLPLDLAANQWERIIGARTLVVYARLRAGISPREAATEMREFTSRTLEASRDNQGFTYGLQSLREQEWPEGDRAVLFVQVGSFLLLLLAVLNLALVLIAWGVDRRQEMAVRLALGAGAGRIALGLLFQGMALVLTASLGGFALAALALPAIRRLEVPPPLSPYVALVSLDARLFVFGTAVALVAGLAAAAGPAWLGRKAAIADSLRSGSRSSGLSPAAVRVQRTMLALQATFTVVLLAGAASLGLSFRNLARVPTGFESAGRMVARVQLPADGYGTHAERAEFALLIEQAMRQQPEIARAGFTTTLPLGEVNNVGRFVANREEADPALDPPVANLRRISTDYLATMGIPILAGRPFDANDDGSSPQVAIVSRSAADRLWPGLDPIGRPLYRAVEGEPLRFDVVGVAGDLVEVRFDLPPGQTVYLPYAQSSGARISFVIESKTALEDPTLAFRRALRSAAPGVAAGSTISLASIELQANMLAWLQSALVSAFAVIALCIALLGTYGVMSQFVATRQRDHAVRLAFGAVPSRIAASIVGSAAAVTLPGVAAGVGASWLISEFLLRPLLFEVEDHALGVGMGVGALMLLLIVMATLPPALRAARVRVSAGIGPS